MVDRAIAISGTKVARTVELSKRRGTLLKRTPARNRSDASART